MGGLCGVAAALLFGRVGLAPLSAGVNLELQVIAAIIVGGVGALWRPRHDLRQLHRRSDPLHDHERLILMGVKQYWDGVATGAVILVAVGLDLLVRQGAGGRLSRADV